MDSTNKLHPIWEWEKQAKNLPVLVTFINCLLDNGKVTQFTGTVYSKHFDKKVLVWKGDGKCYYKGRRIKSLDIHF